MGKRPNEKFSTAAFVALALSGGLATEAYARSTFEVCADSRDEVSNVGKVASLLGLRLTYDQTPTGKWLVKLQPSLNVTYCD